MVIYTNNQIIGFYHNGTCNNFPLTTEPFKQVLPCGHLLEYFNSRLYVASDEIIRFSDVSALHQFDTRSAVIPMPGKITLMKAVKDGMYVSVLGDGTYFFPGKDALDFTAEKFTDAVAILYSGILVEGDELTQGTGVGNIILWASTQGMFVGYPGGEVKNVSWNHYLPDEVSRVAAIYRTDLDYSQYIATYVLEGESEIEIKIPTPKISSVGETNIVKVPQILSLPSPAVDAEWYGLNPSYPNGLLAPYYGLPNPGLSLSHGDRIRIILGPYTGKDISGEWTIDTFQEFCTEEDGYFYHITTQEDMGIGSNSGFSLGINFTWELLN